MYEDMQKLEQVMSEKFDLYKALQKKDGYVVQLLHWIDALEEIKDEVDAAGMDTELVSSLNNLTNKLIKEVGYRVSRILP